MLEVCQRIGETLLSIRMPERHALMVHLSLLLVAVIWGGNFVAMKYLIGEVGSLHLLLIRIYLAATIFSVFLLIRARAIPRFPRSAWKLLVLVGLFGVISNQGFVSFGTSYLSAALASMLVTSTPIFMVILSRIAFGERLSRQKLAGIGLAFCGFLIVLLFGSGGADFSVSNAIGVLITLMAPLSWTISTLISRPLMLEYDPKIVTAVSTLAAGTIMLPVLAFEPSIAGEIVAFDMNGWLAAIEVSVLSIVVAYTLWYQGLRQLEPTQIAIYVYLVPFFGVLFAWLILGEVMTLFALLGGATIIAGVIVTNSDRRPAVISDTVDIGEQAAVPAATAQPALSGEEANIGK